MSIEQEFEVSIDYDSSFQQEDVMEKELTLIKSILPEILQEIMIQSEINKE
ncbi:MAG: hypothetical protein JNL77_01885 [Nitrosomonas sp.]|nr:hypothetical protein [Nitrosomonas sp.]